MRRLSILFGLLALCALPTTSAWADPTFVNGIVVPGSTLDASGEPGANKGRFGFFSDLYYAPVREEWWALSDRGPGGGVLDTRRASSASRSTCIRRPGRSASSG